MKNYILECCVDSVESALNAERAGADRIELCGGLPIGGTTPSVALLRRIRRETQMKVHVLIRPRFGDFCYAPYELDVMAEEIRMFRQEQAQGVVIGVLDEDGNMNLSAMEKLIREAGDMHITLHRAFDMCKDPMKTMEEAIELGIHTILTSGQRNSCWEGRDTISQMIEDARGRIDIMAGGGVEAKVIEKLYPITGGTSYHMSGKVSLDSVMKYRKAQVSMGLLSMSEYEIWQTSEEKVREAVTVLKTIEQEKGLKSCLMDNF